ncbi:hypothetical protein PS865_00763 [Pseudomonas fluorescens]|nr:hypothetical protein PS865_00763 [Pseudomonas fluorescens]
MPNSPPSDYSVLALSPPIVNGRSNPALFCTIRRGNNNPGTCTPLQTLYNYKRASI